MWCLAGDYCTNRRDNRPAWIEGPSQLCSTCLDVARLDVKALVRDYADLENVLPHPGGRLDWVSGATPDPSVPISLAADALQRDVWHLLSTWEEIVREHCGLSSVHQLRVRQGWAVQRAVRVLSPRLPQLAAIGPVACFPDGFDSGPDEMTGAEAILAMRALHRRIGWAIGLRHLQHAMPGPCWVCRIDGGLRRDDGSEIVYCGLCGANTTWDDYHRDVFEPLVELAKTNGR